MLANNCLKLEELDKNYMYVGDYNTLFERTNLLEDILNRISTYSDEEVIEQLKDSYSAEDIEGQISILRNWFVQVNKHKERILQMYEATEADWYGKKALTSLLINVSHDCNLRCIYCYGDGGDYGKSRKLMTLEKAKEIIDFWLEYLNIEDEKINVAFFGGEPLMNKEVLLFAVNYINESLSRFNKSVNYSITTNGTILDEDILEMLVKNKFSITLSIDGGEEIHNRNRPTTSGKGSFERLKKNVAQLRKYNKRPSARLTLTHENVGAFSKAVKDIWELGISKVMYDTVSSSDNSLKLTKEDLELLGPQLDELCEITYESMIGKGDKILKPFFSISKELHSKIFNPGCVYDSKKILSVDVDGVIFKCQRLSGNEIFNVGDVSTGLDWNKYVGQTKIVCNECWANNLCHKCPQANYINNNDVNLPDQTWCEHKKMQIVKSLKLYIKIVNHHPNAVNEIYSKF